MKNKFFVAMYLRLSRDDEDKDGTSKAESNSIGSQRELIRTFLSSQEELELFDIYADDGYSGSNFDRPEFKRMLDDIETGRVNCVVVKDLSRFGRDYIETGRYLEKIFPVLGVRFIAITDRYDSISADMAERSIILPVKNFINDSYCRDISLKVRSQLAAKRKAGECLAPFAIYGYQKDPKDKNKLIADAYAADIVRRIFYWKMEGLAVSAIADKLNDFGVLSPKEYKKSRGENYRGGFPGTAKASWSSTAVKRILTDETYLGHLIQGKTEKINYKVKKSIAKPETEWIRVENTHEGIISPEDFAIVYNLLGVDGRISITQNDVNPFMGLLFCGDCKEQMIRRVNRGKNSNRVYDICSAKNRGEGCSRHSIAEDVLAEVIKTAICRYANSFMNQARLMEQLEHQERDSNTITMHHKEILRLKSEQKTYEDLCFRLAADLQQGIITKEEFTRLNNGFDRKADELSAAQQKQELFVQEILQAGIASAGWLKRVWEDMELSEVNRYLLISLIKRISIYEGKKIEIEFYFKDPYHVENWK